MVILYSAARTCQPCPTWTASRLFNPASSSPGLACRHSRYTKSVPTSTSVNTLRFVWNVFPSYYLPKWDFPPSHDKSIFTTDVLVPILPLFSPFYTYFTLYCPPALPPFHLFSLFLFLNQFPPIFFSRMTSADILGGLRRGGGRIRIRISIQHAVKKTPTIALFVHKEVSVHSRRLNT